MSGLRQYIYIRDGLVVGVHSSVVLENLIEAALNTDGAHHKQWYLEEIAKHMGLFLEGVSHEKGIAP